MKKQIIKEITTPKKENLLIIPMWLDVLITINKIKDNKTSVMELHRIMRVDKTNTYPHLTKVVRVLIINKYLIVLDNTENKRVKFISLTPKGKAIAEGF